MYALEIQNVYKKYGTFEALKNINFQVSKGSFVGLLGINGAGKTSLIASIAGLNKFNGTIKVMGYDVIKDVVAAKKNLGVVPQELAYDPFLTVYQTLKFQSGLYGVGKNNQAWIHEVIDAMHLKDKINSNSRQLSGGMKRRLMVAQALVHKPQVIILDEPTAGVDVQLRKQLWDFFKILHKQGHTILLTTHYLEEAEELCDEIIMIDHGQIVRQCSKMDFINHKDGVLRTTVLIETYMGLCSPQLNHLIVSKEGNTTTLHLDDHDNLLTILTQLKADNIQITNINIIQPSLEDMFISYLGK